MTFRNQSKLKAVTFSYDDGVIQDIRLIELLNKYSLKCTFNLNSELLGRPNTLLRNNQRIAHYKVAASDVKYIYDGHEVASHTLSHPVLTTIQDEAEIIRQVEMDRLNLSDLVRYEVVGMAYPGGGVNNNDRVAEIIRCNTGIQYARTITSVDSFDLQPNLFRYNPNACHIFNYERLMRLATTFVELTPDKPQIFYIWGHAYEMDYSSDNWTKLEEFFKLISNRNDVFYGTNSEVLL